MTAKTIDGHDSVDVALGRAVKARHLRREDVLLTHELASYLQRTGEIGPGCPALPAVVSVRVGEKETEALVRRVVCDDEEIRSDGEFQMRFPSDQEVPICRFVDGGTRGAA